MPRAAKSGAPLMPRSYGSAAPKVRHFSVLNSKSIFLARGEAHLNNQLFPWAGASFGKSNH
jgi:hypothetical protein